MKIKKITLFVIILIIPFINGCSSFKNIGSDLGSGLGEQLKGDADTIGSNFVNGMVQSLSSDSSRLKLSRFLDSLLTRLGYTTNEQLKGIRDSLLNDYVNKWIQSVIEDAIGNATRGKLGALRDELIGDKTISRLLNIRNSFFNYYLQQYLQEIERSAGPNLLNDSTSQRIAAVRDTLIGSHSNSLIKAIVDTAMVTLASRLDSDINPKLRGDLSFLQKNVIWVLVIAGIIAITIILIVWKQKRKYLLITRAITNQIADFKDTEIFDQLKEKISKAARAGGIEGDLRNYLNNNGLLHLEKR